MSGASQNNNPSKEILSKNGTFLSKENVSDGPNTPSQLINQQTNTTTTLNPNQHSIIPASGYWPNLPIALQSGAIPESLSSAKWSANAQGFPQQTFLGASIRSFNMTGGFGDNSSSLTVDLVVDEYNSSDNTLAGFGDDVYHSGALTVTERGVNKTVGDNFVPPIPGSPVFFKFGPNFATVEEAFKKTFDDLYQYQTVDMTPPQSAGGVTMNDIIDRGIVNSAPPVSYVDLDLMDAVDGGSIKLATASRPVLSYSHRTGPSKGRDHIVFGGILQSYTQNRTPNGNPLYTVNVVDPREILSNVTLILNNYAGSTYAQKNVLNLYGFLEYNPTPATISEIKGTCPNEYPLQKIVDNTGNFNLIGDDKYYGQLPSEAAIENVKYNIKQIENDIELARIQIANFKRNGQFAAVQYQLIQITNLQTQLNTQRNILRQLKTASLPMFPMTGTGFSRRSSQGIPYYRVQDALNGVLEYYTPLPLEYKEQGFAGKINFRGYNYVIDFGSLPELPKTYFLDFDQINILELALEICDITNRDLFVSLLPVINHPACASLYSRNSSASSQDIIAGIIRLDAIDRSSQPQYGAVKEYIDALAVNKIYVENQDLGYELSNIVTDKFVVGAQEVEMYYFSTNADRDTLAFKKTNTNGSFPNKPAGYEWTLEASLEQQVLPYYGKLGNHAITIPKGFGAYQQILLDASTLNAAGVGSYYVATEMELRCALISFDRWKEFLKLYNDTYMDSIEKDDGYDAAIAGLTGAPQGAINPPVLAVSNTYAVSVPRSVFNTYATRTYGDDGLPFSPCNPPYGYPLYYKRMTKIGIPEAGLTDLYSRWVTLQTNFAELRSADRLNAQGIINSQYNRLRQLSEQQPLSAFEQQYLTELEKLLKTPQQNVVSTIQTSVGLLEANSRNRNNVFAILPSIAKKNNQNAMKVYEFVKSVAEECLGKKFLVKIPKEVNLFYDNQILCPNLATGEYTRGPFGFKPRTTKTMVGTNIFPAYEFSSQFKQEVAAAAQPTPPAINMMQSFLSPAVNPNPTRFGGALSINFNPLTEKYESNYKPMSIGGYFNFDLYANTLGVSNINAISQANWNNLPSGVKQMLVPQDLTNFLNEDGRVSAYVRFDHSQFLTLEGLNSSDYTQQIITANGFITDISDALDNTGPYQFHSFPNTASNQNNGGQPAPGQVVFLKCSVDENLYMPPKTLVVRIPVHGQQVKDIGIKSSPKKIYIPCSGIENGAFVTGSGVYIDSLSFYKANFVPLPIPGSNAEVLDFQTYNSSFSYPGGAIAFDSVYIDTELANLNKDHVYALITLPNRILPNKDSRHRDGHFQTMSAERFKHLMTMDVVRGLPGFQLPINPPQTPPWNSVRQLGQNTPSDARVHAWLAMKKVHSAMSFGFPQALNMTMPSPVYPDLVALPLMSTDRCYGPWVSSNLDGQGYLLQNIGGRVDFIKDENLSPWNYGGYDLLNEAGRLQAEFSNSLMLFSERGSFTIPTIPLGNSLCKALIDGGPLVTSINVDVSTGGARTTYQMDLYTASFGKLQKQKADEISKISRERKKLNSERNALIRKGLGKNQNNRNFLSEYNSFMRGNVPGLDQLGLGLANASTRIVASVSPSTNKNWSSSVASSNTAPIQNTEYNTYGSMQNSSLVGQTAQNFIDQFQLAESYQNSASSELVGDDGLFTPASHGYHANMSSRPNSSLDAYNELYFIDDEDDSQRNVMIYGDRA